MGLKCSKDKEFLNSFLMFIFVYLLKVRLIAIWMVSWREILVIRLGAS